MAFIPLHLCGILLALAMPDSPLADAAERHDHAAVRALVEKGADPNVAQPDGMTPLHWAVHHDDIEIAKLLIGAKSDPKAMNRYGVTPLALACTNGNAQTIALLLDAGADPNAKLRGGETVLMTASRTGKPEPVKLLIARGADVNAKERRGQTAVMWASAEGHAEVVSALIDAKADFRTPLPSGFTPLLFAVREGKGEVVSVLLKAGADVNQATEPKRIPGRGPSRGTSPLVLAVENGHFDVADMLLKHGADPNDQRSGYTPLHMLTWVRKPNRGDDESGDPSPIGSGRLTSLQLAKALVERGANVNARLEKGPSGRGVLNRAGASPFLLASMTTDLPYMKLLLELGADPKLPNASHSTPLMAAAGLGCLAPTEEAGTEDEAIEAVKLLMDLGNDVNAVDDNGETAMHGASYKSYPKIVDLLVEKGAKAEVWNRKDKYGWTPLAIAEGNRPGNFKPSPETIEALHRVMRAAGISVPMPGESRPR